MSVCSAMLTKIWGQTRRGDAFQWNAFRSRRDGRRHQSACSFIIPRPKKLLLFPVLGLVLALSGCSTLTSPFSSGAAPSAGTVAPYREQVELTGRLNVVYQKNDKPESATVNFNWQQTAQRTDVTLYTPLGSTLATIAVTPQEAGLTQSDKAPRRAPDIDTLSAQLLGWSLPVSGLRDWLQGYADGADGRRFAASPGNDSV